VDKTKTKKTSTHHVVHIWSAQQASQTIQCINDRLSVEIGQHPTSSTTSWTMRTWSRPNRVVHVTPAINAATVDVFHGNDVYDNFLPVCHRHADDRSSHGQQKQDRHVSTQGHRCMILSRAKCHTARRNILHSFKPPKHPKITKKTQNEVALPLLVGTDTKTQ